MIQETSAKEISVSKVDQKLSKKSSKSPISHSNLHITNFEVLHIEDFQIISRINEHALMKLSAVILEGSSEDILARTSIGFPIGVYYEGEDISKSMDFIFQGVVTEISSVYKNSVTYLYITAMSNTYHLDVNRQSQSFQNTSMTYRDMIETVLRQNVGASAIYNSDASKAIGEFCIQYKETAWEYLKRMASRFHMGIYPNMTSARAELYFACPSARYQELEAIDFNCHKDLKKYQLDSKNNIPGISEFDYIVYELSSYDIRELGEKVEFQGNFYFIKEAEYRMEGSILLGRYKLCTKNGLKMKKYHNEQLRGISLNGICQAVERDKVRVKLQIDDKMDAQYLFPYSTIAASPDGSGWYCMPEKGDLLRIYFPNEEEKNCYAISSVNSYTPQSNQLSGGGSGSPSVDRMSDPSIRYLRTADNKEIKLTPQGIVISVDDGQALISLDNEGNIAIHGAKSIQMKASDNVNITAGKNINMFASKNISMQGVGGKIELLESGKTRLTGEYVVEN